MIFKRFDIVWIKSLFLLCLVFNSSLISTFASTAKLDSLLNVLDETIADESKYNLVKRERIYRLNQLFENKSLPVEKRYQTYRDLSREYDSYNFDSARVYVVKSAQIAVELNNLTWIHESQIQLALIHARSGMFSDAFAILNSIDKSKMSSDHLVLYYKTYVETFIYQMEYLDGIDITKWLKSKNSYQDSLLAVAPPYGYDYVVYYGLKYIDERKFDASEAILLNYLDKLEKNTREYSVLTSILAFHYELKGKPELQKEYLAISAISDERAAVKENNSLRVLAIKLFEEGQVDRANRYIKKSLEDANFYHARLRNLQIAKVLPIIDKAFQTDREIHEKKLTRLLLLVSLLSLVLMVAIYLVFKQMKKVSKAQQRIVEINGQLNELNTSLQEANETQKRSNAYLAEANLVKEQYIGSFLEISTEYIDKLDSFKTLVNRKIMAGQKNDLLRMTADSVDSIRDLKKLYESFDKAFLNIYPNFVEELNELLREDERYPIIPQTLNQELRIFALIRLGITDSNKMATFLHYSLRTIYNYRSKVKSKAITPDENFEERVKHLCSTLRSN